MESGNVFGGCHDMIALLENSNNSLWVPPPFHENMMMKLDEEAQVGRRGDPKRKRWTMEGEVDTGGEESDAKQSEKKRRLTSEQVQFLEKSFEEENKLEPEKKLRLAQRLGLQPRQVAIWFQNRRARHKNKQIEKEYDCLRASYERLKLDFDCLTKEKDNLQKEVEKLTKTLEQKEGKDMTLNPENVKEDLEEEMVAMMESSFREKVEKSGGGEEVGVEVKVEAKVSTKQEEEASSAKSDVFNSESPPCGDGNCHYYSSSGFIMVPKRDGSDQHQQSSEHLMTSKSLLLPQTPPTFNNFLKVVDDEDGFNNNNINSCNFSLVDDQPFCSWLY